VGDAAAAVVRSNGRRAGRAVHLLQLALGALGLALAWSAWEHWAAQPELVEHYRAVGLGEVGRIAVAAMQSTAAIALLVPRIQVVAALAFGSVMAAIALRNAMGTSTGSALLPMLMGLWALLPTAALLLLRRRRIAAGDQVAATRWDQPVKPGR
jgi:hypothetical protein